VNGPVPTGSELVSLAGSATADQMWSGSSTCWPISYSAGEYARSKTNRTVWSSTAVTSVRYSKPPMSSFWSANVVMTSCGTRGSPSDHCTPSRSVKSMLAPSSETVHSLASQGVVDWSAGLYTSIDS
jgi:hypothetical protein